MEDHSWSKLLHPDIGVCFLLSVQVPTSLHDVRKETVVPHLASTKPCTENAQIIGLVDTYFSFANCNHVKTMQTEIFGTFRC